MKKVRVSAISYLNTMPFVYGLQNSAVANHIELTLNYPAECATMLKEDKTDIGIVPVAVVPDLPEYHIISDYCIGATGKVRSVAVYGTAPLHELNTIYLDFESRTSVLLCQVLAKKFWFISPVFTNLSSLKEVDASKEKTGYVLIGDKTFDFDGKLPYKCDLAEEWIKFRKLPFVFAAWVANKKLEPEFVSMLNDALQKGVNNIPHVVEHEVKNFDKQLALDYLQNNLSYNFDCEKKKGLIDFWNLALGVIKSKVRCSQ
ncbi:MAG: menaquinone biosynthesis protein [Prevotellaceae bacterium]|nr:menaquinone biosynthesis protein [Prevotellaceae bacterium]